MAEVVYKAGVEKESGYLYFVDKDGDISRAQMSRAGRTKGKSKPQKVAKCGVQRESGFLYYVTKDGDVGRSKMARGRKK
jgi:hypothetical protein